MGANYTVVDLEQGSDEWLDWRDNVIGSSDAPTIMGENPWKSIKQLLSEKLGEVKRFSGNAATRRGTALEPDARRRYEEQTGNQVEPAVLQSTTYPWQVASVDGLWEDRRVVVEIKCGESAYAYVARNRQVPKYYFGQLQHILAVTGFSRIDFFSYWPGEDEILLKVMRDDTYIDRLIAAEQAFRRNLLGRRPSPKWSRRVVADKEDDDEQDDNRESETKPKRSSMERPDARIRIVGEYFDDISEAAKFYGVRETTIEDWLLWLKIMPPAKRKELVREIEVRRLDYENGVIGTEEEEEEKEKKICILNEYFDTLSDAAEAYGVKETTIESWLHWLKTMPASKRKKLMREIKDRRSKFENEEIGTEDEEEERAEAEKQRVKEVKRQAREMKRARAAEEERRAKEERRQAKEEVRQAKELQRAREQEQREREDEQREREEEWARDKPRRAEEERQRAWELQMREKDRLANLEKKRAEVGKSLGKKCPSCSQWELHHFSERCTHCGHIWKRAVIDSRKEGESLWGQVVQQRQAEESERAREEEERREQQRVVEERLRAGADQRRMAEERIAEAYHQRREAEFLREHVVIPCPRCASHVSLAEGKPDGKMLCTNCQYSWLSGS